MVNSLHNRLLRRELEYRRYSDVPSIYGDRAWVEGLDIVNELGGHHGCVNALSWSKSGRLLASGSDDTNLIIHSYHPDGQTQPFKIATSIATGHTANIFSVKFMPHSNDNVLVSCAGDSQVRIFDIEHSSRSHTSSSHGMPGQSGAATFNGMRYLNEGDTNTKIFKSHSDRVKRIVTESSPFLFLTCSEDGEVRQWDLRLPSSAYPEPRGGTGWLASRRDPDDRVPPPLISYRRFRLDLNTISCSATQPHYIALGGAHLHCFLHDRRMIGRDLSSERGTPDTDFSIDSDFHGDMMGQATQCVRRFAPNGQRKMSRSSNGHITACKISDANPNELIASWSGDHIYSFDILRSPDARDQKPKITSVSSKDGVKSGESQDRKRKRKHASSPGGSASKQQRSRSPDDDNVAAGSEDMALRVRYENGQSEDIALQTAPETVVENARKAMLSPTQRRALRIAKSVVKLRKLIFSLDSLPLGIPRSPDEPDIHAEEFTDAFRTSQSCLAAMDDVIRTWRYPTDDIPEELALHKHLRKQRDRARRFVQAAGTLSSLLGGGAEDGSSSTTPPKFDEVKAPATEGPFEDQTEVFRYDFLKAIVAWLQGGSQRLIEVFRKNRAAGRKSFRFPIPENSNANSINRYLIRHLLLIAGPQHISDLDVSPFEHDERRKLFANERDAVTAFSHAVELGEGAEKQESSSSPGKESSSQPTEDRTRRSAAVKKFWGLKVARGLLMNAAEGVTFSLADQAFGGLGIPRRVDSGRNQSDIDPEEDDPEVDFAELVRDANARFLGRDRDDADGGAGASEASWDDDEPIDRAADLELRQVSDRLVSVLSSGDVSDVEDGDSDEGHYDFELPGRINEDGEFESDGDSEEDDDVQGTRAQPNRVVWRSVSQRAALRETIDAHVPVGTHSRTYRGHCNVRTVKDVNFYGLRDEYVVSGSDSGHVFVWDRRTTELLTILEGDGDVVNVVQGHPHEPVLAVSGIDATVKIFGADRRAQRDARLGVNVAASRTQSDSGFARPLLRRVRTHQPRADPDPETQEPLLDSARARAHARARDDGAGQEPDERDSSDAEGQPAQGRTGAGRRGLATRRRMRQQYEITARNDEERQGGLRDAYITRGMLHQLAIHLRAHHADALDDDNEGEDRHIELDENCGVM